MISTQEKQKAIVIVDDTADNLRVLTHILREHDYHVRPVRDGQAALNSIRINPPDLILLDIIMPEPDGYEVCRQLKADTHTSGIPVIFLSALGEIQDKVKAFQVGGVDYITKPFQPEEVLARIRTHLTICTLQQELEEQIQRFQSLSEATFEGVIIYEDGRILEINQLALQWFDYQRQELLGTPIIAFFPKNMHQMLLHSHHNEPKPSHETLALRKDGSGFPVEIRMKTLPYQERHVSVAAIRDMSHQKAMEVQNKQLEHENIVLRSNIKARFKFGAMVGKSRIMQELYDLLLRAAESDHAVMICGESGTGKELAARTIHHLSRRHHQAFVPVNCGAISESLFEREFFGHRKGAFTGADANKPGFFDAAHQGTLFLDEVGELAPGTQVKFLRVLESGEYIPVGDARNKRADVRIIAATNKNPEEMVRNGSLREDLFYRLNVITVTLPPLRDRKDDIPLLIDYFLEKNSQNGQRPELPPDVQALFYEYDWPGNVRELHNEIRRFLTTGRVALKGIRKETSGESSSYTALLNGQNLSTALDQYEKQLINAALTQTYGQKKKAADLLGIDRKTLYKKMKKYDLLE